ncbi:MAG TPA: molybdopterin-guanine dinucleotide biosynthesis protein B [Nocardioidaceae bacterium]|nr:molybdopterin-guanine dinucleotide biosynthesis protein B [Nocardioidaceae bacterium]
MSVVCGIVGSAGSGKTALAEALVASLGDAGWRVGYVKHAHQGLDVDRPGSDTDRLASAGAAPVVGTAPGRRFLIETGFDDGDPHLALGGLESCDVVLVEGYHGAGWPKLRVTRAGKAPREAEPPILAEIASDRNGQLAPAELAIALAAVTELLGND